MRNAMIFILCFIVVFLYNVKIAFSLPELKIQNIERLKSTTEETWNLLISYARRRGDASEFPQLSIVSSPDRLIARFGGTGGVVQIGQDLILATANMARANICTFVCPTIANNPQRQKLALGQFIWNSEKKVACKGISSSNYLENWPTDFGINEIDIEAISIYKFPNGSRNFEEFSDNHFQLYIGFVLAHELGHHVLHHRFDDSNRDIILNTEVEADEYAFKLLNDISGTHSEFAILPLLLKLAQLTFNSEIDAGFARALGLRLTSALMRMFEETQPRNEKAIGALREYERMLREMDFAIERRKFCQ